MCGRFQLDVNDSEFRSIFKSLNYTPTNSVSESGDFTPSLLLPSLCLNRNGKIAVKALKWGLSAPSSKGLLINARSETVFTKPFFRSDFENRRCLIPAHGFYEWDAEKKKILFKRYDGAMFFLGGIFRRLETDDKCLILTRSARPPVSAVHDREPIMLEIKQARAWLTDTDAAKNMLENDFSANLIKTD